MASQNKQTKKQVQSWRDFNNIGWSAIAFVLLAIVGGIIKFQPNITSKYLGMINVVLIILFIGSLVSMMVGVWKASLHWKYLAVATALLWVITLPLVMLLLAGPSDDSGIYIPW